MQFQNSSIGIVGIFPCGLLTVCRLPTINDSRNTTTSSLAKVYEGKHLKEDSIARIRHTTTHSFFYSYTEIARVLKGITIRIFLDYNTTSAVIIGIDKRIQQRLTHRLVQRSIVTRKIPSNLNGRGRLKVSLLDTAKKKSNTLPLHSPLEEISLSTNGCLDLGGLDNRGNTEGIPEESHTHNQTSTDLQPWDRIYHHLNYIPWHQF